MLTLSGFFLIYFFTNTKKKSNLIYQLSKCVSPLTKIDKEEEKKATHPIT